MSWILCTNWRLICLFDCVWFLDCCGEKIGTWPFFNHKLFNHETGKAQYELNMKTPPPSFHGLVSTNLLFIFSFASFFYFDDLLVLDFLGFA